MNIIDFLNSSSERTGFKREVFVDSNVPTDLDNLLFVPIFSDFKYSFIFSSILLNQFKNKTKNSKYLIVCSYPGFSQLFKGADEYWSLSDFKYFKDLYEHSYEFENKSKTYTDILRLFNENYRNTINSKIFNDYYSNGFNEKFWKEYEAILNFPMIPSSAVLGKEFLRLMNEHSGYKVFILPSSHLNIWKDGKNSRIHTQKTFYIELINFLKNEKIFPIIWNHPTAYDLTNDISNNDCIIINDCELSKVLSAIRLTGCVLDLFNGTSWLAKVARTPCLKFDERSRYFNSKENELIDFSEIETPNKIVFNFAGNIVHGNSKSWEKDIFINIKNNLEELISSSDRDTWTTTSEINKNANLISLSKNKRKKFGTRFIKISKE